MEPLHKKYVLAQLETKADTAEEGEITRAALSALHRILVGKTFELVVVHEVIAEWNLNISC